jgi:hypothetical protein
MSSISKGYVSDYLWVQFRRENRWIFQMVYFLDKIECFWDLEGHGIIGIMLNKVFM